jgi:hypothetical protein
MYIKHKQNSQQTIDCRKLTEHRPKPSKENTKKNGAIKPKDATYTILTWFLNTAP